jgi:hypothetical protein
MMRLVDVAERTRLQALSEFISRKNLVFIRSVASKETPAA